MKSQLFRLLAVATLTILTGSWAARASESTELLSQLRQLSCLTADGRTLQLNIETGKIEATWGLLSADFDLTQIRTEKKAEGAERFVLTIENKGQSRFNLVFGRLPKQDGSEEQLLGYIEGNTISEEAEAKGEEPIMLFFGGVACTLTYQP
jgi:hypothetical protein